MGVKAFRGLLWLLVFAVGRLAASESHDSACQSDTECAQTFNSKYFCNKGICVHQALYPTTLAELLGLLLIVAISMLANLGGIGGGEVIVSVYIFFFQYSLREAVPLSKVTIFAGALMNFWVNHDRRSELNPNAFLIDYKLISLIVPMMLAGTTVGVVFTKSFPSAIVLVLITALVVKYTINMFLKARKMQKLEDASGPFVPVYSGPSLLTQLATLIQRIKVLPNAIRPALGPLVPQEYQPLPQRDLFDEIKDEERLYRLSKSRKSFLKLLAKDWTSLNISLISLAAVLLCAFLRSQPFAAGGASTCSPTGVTLFFAAQGVCLLMVQFAYRNNLQLLTNLTVGSIEGNKHFFRWIMWNSYVAGMLAGTLGMGGGIIINPMLIELGISPEISTVASSVVVLFTSLSTSSQFLMLGGLSLSNIFLVLIFSGFGAFVAARYLDEIIRAYKRPSLLVWILAVLLLVSSISIPIVGSLRVAQEANPYSFSSPC